MKIIIFKEKHGDRHFSFSNDQELKLIAEFIVRERHDEGWYEDEEGAPMLVKALAGDGATALKLLQSRNDYDYEYERFEIVEPETAEGLKL